MFENLEKRSLSDQIIEKIENMIINGELKAGDKLPSENKLANKFSVSRSTIREALKALNVLGLISKKNNELRIDIKEDNFYLKPIRFLLLLNKTTVDQLYEARKAIEPPTAALAAQNASKNDIEIMNNYIKEMSNSNITQEKFIELNVKFHLVVAESSNNRILFETERIIRHLTTKAQAEIGDSPKVRKNSIYHHKKILEAIKIRDPALAYETMINHLNDIISKLPDKHDQIDNDRINYLYNKGGVGSD